MKLQFDSAKIDSLIIERGTNNWQNEHQFQTPQYFSCAQIVPCMTASSFPNPFGEIYPPESAINSNYIAKIETIYESEAGKKYESMDDFIKSLEE